MSSRGIPIALLVAACGGGPGGAPAAIPNTPAPEEAEVRSYPPDEISRAEIVERGANAHTAMHVIRNLRPGWLRTRGFGYPVVYIDNIRRPDGLIALFDIPLGQIRLMEFISAADATTRWGTGHPGGVIRVVIGR